jgi:AcrR family transcriptional regulator
MDYSSQPKDKRSGLSPRDISPKAQEFMQAALKLFSERNFSNVTIKDIAKEVNANTALIYYYFYDKEHLFRASLEFSITQTLSDYQKLCKRYTNPPDIIDMWFQLNLKFSSTIRQMIKIMINHNVSSCEKNPIIHELIDKFYYNEEKIILSRNIAKGISSGIFKPVDPDETAHFISVHLDGIIASSYMRPNFDIKKDIEAFESIVWGFLGFDPNNVNKRDLARPLNQSLRG